MWLKIVFPGRFPVLAAVGSDGKLYFVARDVARMLGYACQYSFSVRYYSRDLCSLVPERLGCFVQRGARFVFDFEDMMKTVARTSGHHQMPVAEQDEMRRLFYHGRMTDAVPDAVSLYPKTAFSIVLGGGCDVDFQTWLASYVSKTLEVYESRQQVVLRPPPSVESNLDARDFEIKTRDPVYSMVVRAEGVFALKPGEAIRDALSDVENKIRFLDANYDEEVPERCYEINVLVKRREKANA